MAFYCLVISVALFLAALAETAKSRWQTLICHWGAFACLAALVAFRWGVGQDYAAFFDLQTIDWADLSLTPVPLDEFNRLGLLVKMLYYVSDWLDFRPFVFMVSGCMTYFFWFHVIGRHSVNRVLSVSVIVAFFLSPSFNAVWQLWAVSVVFWGYRYVKSRRFIPFSLCVMSGCLVHPSAAMGLLIYPIYNWLGLRMALVLSVLAVLFSGLFWRVVELTGFYAHYAELVDEFPGGTKLMYLYPALVLFLYVARRMFGKSNSGDDHEKEEFERLLSVVLVGCVFPFVFGPHIGNRCGFYFAIFLTLLAPIALRQSGLLPWVISPLLCSLFFITIFLYRANPGIRDTHIPYRSIFSADYEHPTWEYD